MSDSLSGRLDDIENRANIATSLTLGDDNARDCYHIVQDDVPALVAAVRQVLAWRGDVLTEMDRNHIVDPVARHCWRAAVGEVYAAIEGAFR